MSAFKLCKAAGLSSLKELSNATDKSKQTLINWHNQQPKLFAIVVAGAVALKGK